MEDYNQQQPYNNQGYGNQNYGNQNYGNQNYGGPNYDYNNNYDPGYDGGGPNKSVKGLKIMIIIMAVILVALSAIYFMQVKQMQEAFGSLRGRTADSRFAVADPAEGAPSELCENPRIREKNDLYARGDDRVYPSDRLAQYDQ